LAAINPQTGTTVRKSTGSYYTPREVVDYMVTQSLTLYLKSKIETDKKLIIKRNEIFEVVFKENRMIRFPSINDLFCWISDFSLVYSFHEFNYMLNLSFEKAVYMDENFVEAYSAEDHYFVEDINEKTQPFIEKLGQRGIKRAENPEIKSIHKLDKIPNRELDYPFLRLVYNIMSELSTPTKTVEAEEKKSNTEP